MSYPVSAQWNSSALPKLILKGISITSLLEKIIECPVFAFQGQAVYQM
jgi:hypothetical protein